MSLNQVLDQFLGGNQRQHNTSGAPADFPGGIPGGLLGGLAAGGLLGLVAGNKKLRKSAGKLAGGAVALGGAAALGTVAYTAYRKWQGDKAGANRLKRSDDLPARVLPPESFDPSSKPSADGKPFQIALIEAMIAAAYADGHIDQAEHKAIFDAVDKLPIEGGEKAAIFDALRNPADAETIAGYSNGVEQACELYLVSRLAIDPDHPQERHYLEQLSKSLAIPEGLVDELEREIAAAKPIAA
jgi:uncharacterized membrane protein YebE (DUF533 family)